MGLNEVPQPRFFYRESSLDIFWATVDDSSLSDFSSDNVQVLTVFLASCHRVWSPS